MRVCFIVECMPPVYGGGQVHALALLERLVKEYDCEIDVYTRRLVYEGKRYSDDETMFDGKVRLHRVGITSDQLSMVGRLSWVLSVFFRNLFKKYDIIHGQANLGGLPTWMLGLFKRTHTRTLFTVHGSGLLVWDDMAKGFSKHINRSMERLLQTRLKYDVEISVDSKFCMLPNRNKPVVILNGVDVVPFDAVKAAPPKYFKILFVGRLHPQKGLTHLIAAARIIKAQAPKFQIHIVGSGELEKGLRAQVKKAGLGKTILFRGKMFGAALRKEYKSSHLFVLPSLFEGQPLTLFEAWAAGVPVLVTDVGENAKLVREDVNGWVVPSKDPDALAKQLLRCMHMEKGELSRIGKNGYTLVKTKYSWDEMTKKTYALYKKRR